MFLTLSCPKGLLLWVSVPEAEPVGAEPGWQPAHNALPDGLFNGFRKLRTLQLQSNQLARLPQQLFQTLGKVRVMQGDSLIFIVTSHLSNRQIYCTVCNASLVLLRLGLSVAQILHR